MTSKELRSQIKSQIWPSGVAENLDTPVVEGQKSPVDMLFDEAMADVSKWVPCEQQNNVDVIDFCKTHFKCALTVLSAPRGVIRRVFTIDGGDYCDSVFFRQVDWPMPEAEARSYAAVIASDGAALPIGFRPAHPSTDSQAGRAYVGVWAINNRNIYLFPWIQSTEQIVIEWDGVKREWGPDDPVNDAQDYRKTVKFYVKYAYERDYGSAQTAAEFKTLYDQALAELNHQCREETKTRDSYIIPTARDPLLTGGSTMCRRNAFSGTFAIGNGESGGQVVGLDLSFTPRIALVTVQAPVNGLVLFATVVAGTLSKDGFQFVLNGLTDNANYILSYEIS